MGFKIISRDTQKKQFSGTNQVNTIRAALGEAGGYISFSQ